MAQDRHTRSSIVDYYTTAGPDYRWWTKGHNLHFGYYRWGMNPFRLEGMLEEMNRVVVEHLEPTPGSRLLDLGCGLGQTARFATTHYPGTRVDGITLVPWQARQAVALSREREHLGVNRSGRTAGAEQYLVGDFTALPFQDRTFDGVYALESSCYAPGLDKRPLLSEARRVLRPGGRLVIADALLKTTRPMLPWVRACYRALCSCWSLQTLGEVGALTRSLSDLGFTDVELRNISKAVTPSVMHIPWTVVRFAIKELLVQRSRMDRQRWGHVAAGLLLIAFTFDRTRSGYFLVTARTPSGAV